MTQPCRCRRRQVQQQQVPACMTATIRSMTSWRQQMRCCGSCPRRCRHWLRRAQLPPRRAPAHLSSHLGSSSSLRVRRCAAAPACRLPARACVPAAGQTAALMQGPSWRSCERCRSSWVCRWCRQRRPRATWHTWQPLVVRLRLCCSRSWCHQHMRLLWQHPQGRARQQRQLQRRRHRALQLCLPRGRGWRAPLLLCLALQQQPSVQGRRPSGRSSM
jgi:hypothetical protein